MGSPFTWFKDSKSFLINVLPANRPALLSDKNDIPTGPTVATSTGKVSQNATYQDLLKTPKDETNFENLATSELAKVDLNGNLYRALQKWNVCFKVIFTGRKLYYNYHN